MEHILQIQLCVVKKERLVVVFVVVVVVVVVFALAGAQSWQHIKKGKGMFKSQPIA